MYRIKPVKVGVKQKYQIQKKVFYFFWNTILNPVIISPPSPYEFKTREEAEKKIEQLERKAA